MSVESTVASFFRAALKRGEVATIKQLVAETKLPEQVLRRLIHNNGVRQTGFNLHQHDFNHNFVPTYFREEVMPYVVHKKFGATKRAKERGGAYAWVRNLLSAKRALFRVLAENPDYYDQLRNTLDEFCAVRCEAEKNVRRLEQVEELRREEERRYNRMRST